MTHRLMRKLLIAAGLCVVAVGALAQQVTRNTTPAGSVSGLAAVATSGSATDITAGTLGATVQGNITALGTQTGALPMTVGQSITWGGALGVGSFSTSTLIRPTNATGTNGVSIQSSAGANLFGCINSGGCTIGPTALVTVGSELGINKITASGSAPGASGAKISLVCGTNAGTAKLIISAGTSGTNSTILDNIGAGVSGC